MTHRMLVSTPLGALELRASSGGLREIVFPPSGTPAGPADCGGGPASGEAGPVLAAAQAWLQSYLRGDWRGRPDFPVERRGTPFQQEVWRALSEIPAGETRTYGEIARALGRPGAARAVGAACARNPLPILVPCHRVVGGGGELTGFAGGLAAKRWLLEHERRCEG